MKRILILAHREELIFQAVAHARNAGLTAGIEMGKYRANGEDVIVTTVQTQNASRKCIACQGSGCGACGQLGKIKRMERFSPFDFGLVVVDEGHHCVAKSYRLVLEWFKKNPDLKVLLVTATPKRADGDGLHNVCDSVAYEMDLRAAIDEGWLCPIRQMFVTVDSLDLSEVSTKAGGDLADGELERAFLGGTTEEEQKLLHAICYPCLQEADGKPILVFASGCAHAEKLTAAFNAYDGLRAELVLGTTDKEERRRIVDRYKSGETQILVGVGCFCLDEQTEILTSDGWVGIDEMSISHEVANWDDGDIFFDTPRAIIRRDRLQDERMVSLKSKMLDIRVTESHRMLYRTWSPGKFKISHAHKLAGRSVELPVSGVSRPRRITPEQPVAKTHSQTLSAIRSNSYILRQNGMDEWQARKVAIERYSRRHSLRYTNPSDLSSDECHFIGFWLGDGTKCALQSGGVEFSCAQSMVYRNVIEWFDGVIESCGIHVKKRSYPLRHNGVVTWSFCRGTGFGAQYRNGGVFHLEPYLDKSGSELLWGLNSEQFTAIIEGLWFADGEHGRIATKPPSRFRIACENKPLADILQSIAVCRGFYSSVTPRRLAISPKVSIRTTDNRLEVEDGWRSERVWCVTSTTGNIITRRNGHVVITGNTEGFDAPNTAVCAIARPTKSESLYLQMIGRGTRPQPGVVDGPETAEARRQAIAESNKTHTTIIDFVGNSGRHKLVSVADVLAGNDVDPVDLEAALGEAKSTAQPVDMDELIEKSKQAREAKERRREEERKQRLMTTHKADDGKYTTEDVDLFRGRKFDAFRDYQPIGIHAATVKQVNYIVKLGVSPEKATGFSLSQAGAVISKLTKQTGSDYVMRFGKHSGKKLSEIPSSYITWASENITDKGFHRNLALMRRK